MVFDVEVIMTTSSFARSQRLPIRGKAPRTEHREAKICPGNQEVTGSNPFSAHFFLEDFSSSVQRS